jgi:hypothetical protein
MIQLLPQACDTPVGPGHTFAWHLICGQTMEVVPELACRTHRTRFFYIIRIAMAETEG